MQGKRSVHGSRSISRLLCGGQRSWRSTGGAALVAVSIAPERTVMSGAPVERQAVATSAYTTLLNQKEGKILGLFCETALSALLLIHGFSERIT